MDHTQLKKYLVSGILLLIIVAVAGVIYVSKNGNSGLSKTDQLVQESLTQALHGQCADAITTGDSATTAARSPRDAASVKYAHAVALECRMQGDDLRQAMDAFKAVALDANASPVIRASAYYRLGGLYFDAAGLRPGLMQSLVFNDAPFSDYMKQAGGDVAEATRALFEQSRQLNETSYADYELAALDAIILHRQGFDAQSKAQQALAHEILRDVAAGDVLRGVSSTTAATGNLEWWNDVPRAIAIGTASNYLSEISYFEAAHAYERAIEALTQAGPGSEPELMQARILLVKFSYAALASAQGQAASSKVKDLLSGYTFAPGVYPQVDSTIGFILKRPKTDPTRAQIARLAATSQPFASYLGRLQAAATTTAKQAR